MLPVAVAGSAMLATNVAVPSASEVITVFVCALATAAPVPDWVLTLIFTPALATSTAAAVAPVDVWNV